MIQLLDGTDTEIATRRLKPSFSATSPDEILMTRARVERLSGWDGVIEQLKAWRDELQHDRDCLASGARQQAVTYARLLASDGGSVPSRVGISNNGGIAFEWERGDALVHIEVLDTRHAEYTEFSGTSLVEDAELIWDQGEQVYVPLDS